MDKKVLLMILDGWGEGRQDESNVIYTQGAPYIEGLRKQYPMSTLKACGEAVGLPEGQMGNSEVGHLNLGAGRGVPGPRQDQHRSARAQVPSEPRDKGGI